MDPIIRTSDSNISSVIGRTNSHSSPVKQGQHFEPLDKASSSTVKLNPKMNLQKADLLKLLSCMEAELQSRDIVIATLKTERIKNLLHYGKVSVNDPILALERDSIGGMVLGGAGISPAELHHIEETQLQQLENLITQQRRAQARMRHILREAEKRHAWTVDELEKQRQLHNLGLLPEDDFTPCDPIDQDSFKQELDYERMKRKQAERELKKVQEMIEEERGKQKQIILMLVEERKRLALQYVEERKRSEDLAQILSEEKGRIDLMAEGLEEESKKSLQMEAELEKQLAEFDTERQQMRGQMLRKEDRITDLEAAAEKLHREVEHYKKQLQEAHNVAMFQQTLSVSPPRLGISQPRTQPPQIPVKPTSLGPGQQQRLQSSPALSNVTKAVQLTATVNSVPVTGPTTGIARGVQPGIGARQALYSAPVSDLGRSVTTAAKTFSENDSAWMGSSVLDCDTPQTLSLNRQAASDAARSQSQIVQVSPRVNVSASPGSKVITTTHGGKVTLHVTTNTCSTLPSSGPGGASNNQSVGCTQTILKKPLPPARSATGSVIPPTIPSNKSLSAPPVPPNKPVVPPKKDLVSARTAVVENSPISVEVKPQKGGSQTVKFGITISKTSATQSASGSKAVIEHNLGSAAVEGTSNISLRRESTQVDGDNDAQLHDSLSPELENFHQLLSSMAGCTNLVEDTDSTKYSQHLSSSSQTLTTLQTDYPLPIGDNPTPNHCVPLENLANSSREPSCQILEECSTYMSNLGQNGPMNGDSSMSNCLPLNDNLPDCSPVANTNDLALTVDVSNQDMEPCPPHSPVDVSTPLTVDGMTALHLAAQGNNFQFVPMLIRCGSSAYAEDDEGRTPLYIALLYGCTMAAQVLLQYAENLEHTTKSGNNYLHAAIKSGDLPCLLALLQSIQSRKENSIELLHLLASSRDHTGCTPLSLSISSPPLLQALANNGLNVKFLVAHHKELLHSAPSDSLSLLQPEGETITCKILLQGSSIFNDLGEVKNWTVGCVLVNKETTWPMLLQSVTDILMTHWQKLCWFSRSEIDGLDVSENEGNNSSNLLELVPSSIESILIGKHYWSERSPTCDKSPYDSLECEFPGFTELIAYLRPLETISYSCLIPVSLVENYLRLLEQSKCIVLYGAKNSGKLTLARFLTSFYCKTFRTHEFTRLSVAEDSFEDVLDNVRAGISKGSVLLLERVPKDLWPALAQVWKEAESNRQDTRILATVDSWRRPSGKFENDVLWVQLRHDREPLCNFVDRWCSRNIASITGGFVPLTCEWYEVVSWIANSYSILCDILMSLGFSSVLRGPNLFTRKLAGVSNCRDILIRVNELWWEELAPAICEEVDRVWHSGHLDDVEAYDKKRICVMAVHVIQQKVLLSHVPRCAQLYPYALIETNDRFESKNRRPTLPPRPKNLHLLSQILTPRKHNDNNARSPLSPEWTQDNLAKILGLTPMGYS